MSSNSLELIYANIRECIYWLIEFAENLMKFNRNENEINENNGIFDELAEYFKSEVN